MLFLALIILNKFTESFGRHWKVIRCLFHVLYDTVWTDKNKYTKLNVTMRCTNNVNVMWAIKEDLCHM